MLRSRCTHGEYRRLAYDTIDPVLPAATSGVTPRVRLQSGRHREGHPPPHTRRPRAHSRACARGSTGARDVLAADACCECRPILAECHPTLIERRIRVRDHRRALTCDTHRA